MLLAVSALSDTPPRVVQKEHSSKRGARRRTTRGASHASRTLPMPVIHTSEPSIAAPITRGRNPHAPR